VLDTWSDEDQAEMGALLVAEWSKCPNGHPLALSLRTDLSVLVTDEVCQMCKATSAIQRAHQKKYGTDDPDGAPSFADGRFYFARPRLNGGSHGG
jgi:tRNA(Arg) A34 adenosine deaminase TadA